MQPNNRMNKILSFICILTNLLACTTKPNKPISSLTQEELKQYVNTLSLYLNADTNLIAKRRQFYQLLKKYINTEGKIDSIYYIKNIAHVDSVIHKAIGLVEQSNANDLLSLLEKERHNIYAHPCNTIDNEIALHNLLIQLYNKAYKENTDEYYSKIIDLALYDKLHLTGLLENEQYTPYYIHNLTSLVDLYMCANRYTEAIQTGRELCEFTKDEDNSLYIQCVLLLGSAYKEAGLTEQQDSCINSIKHFSEFEEIYDAYMKQ